LTFYWCGYETEPTDNKEKTMSEETTERKQGDFTTAFESINSDHQTAKEAGLTQEEAVAFEKKECSKALDAALLKEDVSDAGRYGIIREHVDLLLSALDATAAMYA